MIARLVVEDAGELLTVQRAAYVGDSITDANTARAAGIPFLALSFGFSDRPVGQLGAQAVIHDYRELVRVLRSL